MKLNKFTISLKTLIRFMFLYIGNLNIVLYIILLIILNVFGDYSHIKREVIKLIYF